MAYLLDISEYHSAAWMRFWFAENSRGPIGIWDYLQTQHGAVNVTCSPYIRFECEEDAVAFLLKWS